MNRSFRLLEAIGDVDEKFLEQNIKKERKNMMNYISPVLVAAMIVGCVFVANQNKMTRNSLNDTVDEGIEISETTGDYPAMIMVNNKLYYYQYRYIDASKIDEESFLGYTSSYTSNEPKKEGETNFDKNIGMPYAKYEKGIVVQMQDGNFGYFEPKGLFVENEVKLNEIDIVADIAALPENDNVLNLLNATMDNLSESEAYNEKDLGKHLPTVIPDDYHFRSAGIYKSTMKNGIVYKRLVVNYTFDNQTSSELFEEELDTLDFSIAVMNYKPKEDLIISTENTIPTDVAENDFYYLERDNAYIEIITGDLTYDEIISVIRAIK